MNLNIFTTELILNFINFCLSKNIINIIFQISSISLRFDAHGQFAV